LKLRAAKTAAVCVAAYSYLPQGKFSKARVVSDSVKILICSKCKQVTYVIEMMHVNTNGAAYSSHALALGAHVSARSNLLPSAVEIVARWTSGLKKNERHTPAASL
jgi:hypothetical protein